VTAIVECLWDTELSVRESILNGFDEANSRARDKGGATTLAVIAFSTDKLRSFHAGDSQALVTGQRGRVKLQTVAHSPVGYAVEAGVLSEKDAMNHEDRHLVSNLVGSAELKVEMGSKMELSAKDTIIMGSDGVFDNVRMEEVVEAVRIGNLAAAARRLRDLCQRRMSGKGGGPSKPDDLTFLLARRTPAPKKAPAPGPPAETHPSRELESGLPGPGGDLAPEQQ
jgi:serine/threonine protein phosphatase PrpC